MKKAQGNNNEVVTQFARALFDVAREKKSMLETLESAQRIAHCYNESLDLQRLFTNPKFESKSVEKVLDELNSRLKLGKTIHICLILLARKKKLNLLPKIVVEMQRLISQERGEVKGHIVSAMELRKDERTAVERALKDRLQGNPLALTFEENKSLLSGFVLTIQNRMIDLSLRSELQRLHKILYKTEQTI